MADILIPKGFVPIALSEIGKNVAIVFYNDSSQKFLFKVGDNLIGPINVFQLPVFHHAVNDVLQMKGNYNKPISIPQEYE